MEINNLLLWMLTFACALRMFGYELRQVPLVAVAAPETARLAQLARR
jgi:hypothetical protein